VLEDREISVRLNRKDRGQYGPGGNGGRSNIQNFEDKVVLIEKVFNRAGRNAILGVCAYVLLDTFRKVVVSRAGK
jgi:hypothetical protein